MQVSLGLKTISVLSPNFVAALSGMHHREPRLDRPDEPMEYGDGSPLVVQPDMLKCIAGLTSTLSMKDRDMLIVDQSLVRFHSEVLGVLFLLVLFCLVATARRCTTHSCRMMERYLCSRLLPTWSAK